MPVRTLAAAMALCGTLAAQNFADVLPSPQQVEWQDLEIGVLIHFGLNTFTDKEWGDGTVDPKLFRPTQLDAAQWVRAAKSAGAKYLIMVAKHHDGFCLWPSRHTAYSVKSSPWKDGKGDVVGEVAQACRRHGLKFGVYLSPWDRHEPAYRNNAAYDRYYAAQVDELATRYGPITEFWLDGAGSEGHVYDFERYIRRLRTYQPDALIFADVGLLPWGDIRWVGNEAGVAQEENWNVVDAYKVLRWRPAECDTPLRERHWFWHPNDESSLKPLSRLLEIYHQSVGRGAQLVLGLAPDSRGLLPESDVARLAEFGAAIRKLYGNNLARGAAASDAAWNPALDGDPETFWSAPQGAHHAEVEMALERPARIARAVTMEWLNTGQQVQKYDIQAFVDGQWRTLASGASIGHKKIDTFPAVTAGRVRFRIRSAARRAHIREFQLYGE